MNGRSLLKLLMGAAKENPNSLAQKLRKQPAQSTIQRYLDNDAIEPKRASIAAIAKHYNLPPEAFYNPALADQIAIERKLVSDVTKMTVGESASSIDEQAPIHDTDAPGQPIPTKSLFTPTNLSSAILLLGNLLGRMDKRSRHLMGTLLTELADDPDDAIDIAYKASGIAEKQKPLTRNKALDKALKGNNSDAVVETGRAPLGH